LQSYLRRGLSSFHRRKPLPAIASAQARRAGLCGLAHQARSIARQQNSSFMNWKLTPCPTPVTLFVDGHYLMKIGLMNNPSASVYDEIISFAQAGFDFVDLTIEGPNAANPDPERIRVLLDQIQTRKGSVYSLTNITCPLSGTPTPASRMLTLSNRCARPVSRNLNAVQRSFLLQGQRS